MAVEQRRGRRRCSTHRRRSYSPPPVVLLGGRARHRPSFAATRRFRLSCVRSGASALGFREAPLAVITISATYGALGSEVGHAVAAALDAPFLDRAIPVEVAEQARRAARGGGIAR